MENEFSLKELEQVFIKTTYPIEVNGKTFMTGETVAAFDKIQLANFNEIKTFISANGGFDNRAHIWWETTKEIQLNFFQGVFSHTQFAIMNNIKTLLQEESEILLINKQETTESDEDGNVKFSHVPLNPLFVYDIESGNKITNYVVIDSQTINIGIAYKSVLLDYPWEYTGGSSTFIVGRQLTNGTFVLTGKTKVKDDITGLVRTGILTIPKLKLMSDLSMRLGSDAKPMVATLKGVASPVGARGRQVAMQINFLNDDIDSDI